MLIMNIIFIILNCLSLSFQYVKSALFCDDRILKVYVYDESIFGYRLLQTLRSPEDCYTPDYIDLDIEPGSLIKYECINDAAESLGAGCFLINGRCYCYDFSVVGRYVSYSGNIRRYDISFSNGVKCYYYAHFLKEQNKTIYEYSHRVPLDADEITCKSKTISAPINTKNSLYFSDFVSSPFGLTNLKISIYDNYKYFTLDNSQLSSSTKFNILSKVEYSSDQSKKISIEFKYYGVVFNDYKYCEFYIRFCYDSCLECNDINPNETSHQCLKCKKDYYFIENTNNCMTINQMKDNHSYYFDNSTKLFKPCYDRCQKCNIIKPNETSHQCLECKDGFYFIENTNNCMTIEEMENSTYYFDNSTKLFKPCYDSCQKCNDIESNETSHQCLECKDGFYFIENTNNCMTIEEMENSTYYFDNSTKLFKPCYDSCQKCNDIESNETSHQCLECKDGFYFIENTNNCMTIEEMENSNHYYFDNINKTFKSCFESCKECYFKVPNNDSHQCLECKDDFYFIENTNNCMTIKEMENSNNYYFDNKNKKFKSCFERCKECYFEEPNNNSHQCSTCNYGFYFIENTSNCMTIEEMENSAYYFDNNKGKFKQCLNSCSTCDNEIYCKNCAENYHFIYNEKGKCISEKEIEDSLYLNKANNTYMKCPEGTEKVENNECIKSSNISLIIILIIVILIIIIVLFFFIKRCISRKNLENEISNTLEKNDSDNQLINIFL